MRARTLLTTAACTAAVLGVTTLTPATAAPTAPRAATARDTADFNADGYPDLVIGAPGATAGGVNKSGAMSVVYGSATGFQYDKASVITRATAGVPGAPNDVGGWGNPTGHGDLDRDGYDDLVVAWYDLVYVFWGSKRGITGATTLVPTSSADAMPPGPGRQHAWAVGDVNADGAPDIISSTRGDDRTTQGVVVEYGPFSRTTGRPHSFVTHNTLAQEGQWADGGRVGDLTGDGIADVMVYGLTEDGKRRTTIFKGTRDGLVKSGSVADYLNGEIGDINGDGFQDHVGSGRPRYNNDGGQIVVTYGGPDGISTTIPSRMYTQNSPGVPGVNEPGDHFGTAVDVADVDGDGYADVLIGSPREIGSGPRATRSGAITMLRGSKTGITTTGAKSFTQNSAGIPDTSEINDKFGHSIRVLDSDKNGKPEVYVGGPGEYYSAGRVWQLKTDTTGVMSAGATIFGLTNLGGPKGFAEFGYRIHG
ncbi:FG-GAP-like repeat-containing protein [Streptomyces sp. AP-93]|uniref:FG-GAP-like repeat-containing protein n=1 Tax=Streptomyces sp. AP-93 TaxID=2929048 RepID=UPI001FB047E6|nr:FG-GAP-like repeat-containing protein [Streptomyces sp. AP-93]MCJ0873618.1 FG-GAP-like repeat-containing protein [Streptomyces sp. AP-93]